MINNHIYHGFLLCIYIGSDYIKIMKFQLKNNVHISWFSFELTPGPSPAGAGNQRCRSVYNNMVSDYQVLFERRVTPKYNNFKCLLKLHFSTRYPFYQVSITFWRYFLTIYYISEMWMQRSCVILKSNGQEIIWVLSSKPKYTKPWSHHIPQR